MTPSPTVVQLLIDLADHGIDVQMFGEGIRYRPRQTMTPDLLQRVTENKAELLVLLRSREQAEAIIAEARDFADWLAEAWFERISIVTADNIPLAVAETTALQQLLDIVTTKR